MKNYFKHLSFYEREYGLFNGLVLPKTVKTIKAYAKAFTKLLMPIALLCFVSESFAEVTVSEHLQKPEKNWWSAVDWVAGAIAVGGCTLAVNDYVGSNGAEWKYPAMKAGACIGLAGVIEAVKTGNALLI